MNNDTTPQKIRLVKEFLEQKGNEYLRLIKIIEFQLLRKLGKKYKRTNTAEDIFQEILCDLLDGTRAWDVDSKSLQEVIKFNISSEISNIRKKEMRIQLLSCQNENDGNDDFDYNGLDELINTKPEDIESIIDTDSIRRYSIDVILQDDPDGQIVLDEMFKDKKQKQIADYLGISVDEAEIIIRRIRRKILKEIPPYLIEIFPDDLMTKYINKKRKGAYEKNSSGHTIQRHTRFLGGNR